MSFLILLFSFDNTEIQHTATINIMVYKKVSKSPKNGQIHHLCYIQSFFSTIIHKKHLAKFGSRKKKIFFFGQTSVYYTNSFRTNHSLQNPKWLGDPKTVYGMHQDPHQLFV